MALSRLTLVLALLVAPLALQADPESDVRQAVTALARSSYAWETTVRQRFTSESRDLRPNPNAAIEVRGRVDPQGYTEITLQPSRDLAAPLTAVFLAGDVVGQTPVGWLRRTAMRQVPGQDRMVDFGGRQVRLSRVVNAALQVTARRTAAEDLLDLLEDLKGWNRTSGLVIAELPDRAVERLWGDPQAKRAPEIHGTVIFQFNDAGLAQYHVVLAIGFPNSRTQKVAWSMAQWSTRFTGIGATAVKPPAAAIKALEDQSAPP